MPTGTDIRVSLATTCMGRRHHLERTLPRNLQDNIAFKGLEFVLLDYSSPDGLGEWVFSNWATEIRSGLLSYYKLDGQTTFRRSYAKNLAHRLSTGAIVCNVDADNFTGPNFAKYLYDELSQHTGSFVRLSGRRGTTGRIALRSSDFVELGGYDERFDWGWGFEDEDLALRARSSGLVERIIQSPSVFSEVIRHRDDERVEHMLFKDKDLSRARHIEMSLHKRLEKDYVANRDCKWGSARVTKNGMETVVI